MQDKLDEAAQIICNELGSENEVCGTRIIGKAGYVDGFISYCDISFRTYLKPINKQLKENTMKEFNLEEAKAGKPVCTRDGRDVEILKYDRIGFNQPMITLVDTQGYQCVELYCEDGSYNYNKTESNYDLFMKTEKHEAWVNVYRLPDKTFCYGGVSFNTENEAKLNNEINFAHFGKIKACGRCKVEWEE